MVTLAQPCYVALGGAFDLGLIFRHVLRALSVGMLTTQDKRVHQLRTMTSFDFVR